MHSQAFHTQHCIRRLFGLTHPILTFNAKKHTEVKLAMCPGIRSLAEHRLTSYIFTYTKSAGYHTMISSPTCFNLGVDSIGRRSEDIPGAPLSSESLFFKDGSLRTGICALFLFKCRKFFGGLTAGKNNSESMNNTVKA